MVILDTNVRVAGPAVRPAAEEAGRLAAGARASGRTIAIQDVQIAGIARALRAALATGNSRHFHDAGIALIDPWREAGL
jgi:predicted nucleic acid-binding protein